jgi:hypothetical protein
MAGDEHHALRIVRIMKDAGTAAGEIMMFGAVEAVPPRIEGSSAMPPLHFAQIASKYE